MILKPAEIEGKTQMWEQRKDNIEWEKREIEKAEQKSSRINYEILSTLKEALSTKHPAKTGAVVEELGQKPKLNLKKEEAQSDESSDEDEPVNAPNKTMEGLGDIFGGGGGSDDDYD